MRIKPTMSHAINEEHLNRLLVKYYQDLVSEYDANLGAVHMKLKQDKPADALHECELFIDSLDN